MGEYYFEGEKHAYEIRVKNHHDTSWADWFERWTITNGENDEVIFFCPDVDLAALYGVLDKIRDLDLTLISVKRLPAVSLPSDVH